MPGKTCRFCSSLIDWMSLKLSLDYSEVLFWLVLSFFMKHHLHISSNNYLLSKVVSELTFSIFDWNYSWSSIILWVTQISMLEFLHLPVKFGRSSAVLRIHTLTSYKHWRWHKCNRIHQFIPHLWVAIVFSYSFVCLKQVL